ncbi:hypothetical protein RHMOL_Rhmol01G0073200 [Rhododendron molle]|uniref:Uncharacterized protein n=1 Tax=Rhododendron molle TaxID=49168 RepID=A0ACC0PZ70_RHOML|nr:hypothetical protein RHMOL_Rhmol01G0073200 [Rhododendron molle]
MGALTWLFPFLLYFLQYQVAASSSSPLSSFASSAHPLCRLDQRSALLQFKLEFKHMLTEYSYTSLGCELHGGIPGYPKALSWDENATDCCDWDGVTCDELTGHVVGLDLSCSQIYGTFKPNSSLFQLSHLQRLNLAFNHFNFSFIPNAIGSFASLTHLNLSESGFSGSIPSELSLLSKLISLDLSFGVPQGLLRLEPLHFKILLKNVTQLQELVLRGVNISSGLPDSLSNLTSLTALDLSSTELIGKVPDGVFHLPNLQKLVLRYNLNLDINLPKSTWGSGSSLRELELSITNLSGELPDSIGYLKSLKSLVLSFCKLRGSIPKSLGNLTQIRELYLTENDFTGEVPSTISNLKQLTHLELNSNDLGGRIPASVEFPMLEVLNLRDNNFKGPIPFNLSGLQNLRELYLNNNSLNGVIPPSLFTLMSLEDLDLSSNHLVGQIPLLFSLPSLISLDLSSNHLTGQIPEFQHHLPLESIDLSDNKLRGPIPQSIFTLVNLTGLFLASNDLSGIVEMPVLKNVEYPTLFNNTLPNLQVLASLQYLDLSHNFLTGMNLLPWERLVTLDLHSNLLQGPLPIPPPSTTYFFISNNNLSGEIPLLICNASSLQILDLSHNKLSGAIPQCLASVLSVLNLHSNGFTGSLHLKFAMFNQLQSLDLSRNQFEGPLPRSLKNCTSLEVLNVGNNKINDTFPYWLGTLPELQVLVIRSNRFHGPINTMMSEISFPKVRIFDLSYNEFTGHLPVNYFENFQAMKNTSMSREQYMSWGGSSYHYSLIVTMKGLEIELVRILTIFTTIDFSSNNFGGEIPNIVGTLNSLILLNFSHNNLTGHIPASLGNLTNLESLDISSNQLTGKIPSQLTSLTFLEVLNLSWNRLHGPIPRGKQFATFENGSYAGNLGLCGFPMSNECQDNRTKIQPPVLQHEEDDSDFDGFFWKVVVIGYGCGMTLGLFLGSLMFLIGRPRLFVKLAERKLPKKVIRLRRTVADTVARRN